MNARMGLHNSTPSTAVPRKFTSMSIEVKAINQEIEVPADAALLGIDVTDNKIALFLGAPEGSGPVRRKFWVVPQGGIIIVEAQNGEYLGHVVLRGNESQPNVEPSLFYAAVFIETQKQAIERATYRAGFRSPPSTSGGHP